jgi:hypothetical protein
MGDIADYYIDQMLDYDLYESCGGEEQETWCQRCGADGLYWSVVWGGYRLMEADGFPHKCDPAVLAGKVFGNK